MMAGPNRTIAPAFKEIEKIEILRAEEKKLTNGIPVFFVNAGTEEVIKIDLIFSAGTRASVSEKNLNSGGSPLLASAVNHLIPEGTESHSSAQIAEQIDFFGAFIQTDCDKDIATVSLITLNKHLKNTLPILEEIIKEANFPENELSTYLINTKQKFIVDSEKVHVISRRTFNEVIFGKNNPYGKNIELNDFVKIHTDDLKKFFHKFYSPLNCRIIISGKINDQVFPLLNRHFGSWKGTEELNIENNYVTDSSTEKRHFIERKNQVQSAIRIGRPLFSKNHPDYPAMKVLNVLLGGYFGSRLMANVREDKGYTYGIGSAVFPMIRDGCFFISTEVGTGVTSQTLKEIYFEVSRIRENLVQPEELQKVRNYMLGEFVRSVDGPFALAERLKGLLIFGLGYEYYDNFIFTIKNTQPERLMELAQKYLKEEDLYEVVVGGR